MPGVVRAHDTNTSPVRSAEYCTLVTKLFKACPTWVFARVSHAGIAKSWNFSMELSGFAKPARAASELAEIPALFAGGGGGASWLTKLWMLEAGVCWPPAGGGWWPEEWPFSCSELSAESLSFSEVTSPWSRDSSSRLLRFPVVVLSRMRCYFDTLS